MRARLRSSVMGLAVVVPVLAAAAIHGCKKGPEPTDAAPVATAEPAPADVAKSAPASATASAAPKPPARPLEYDREIVAADLEGRTLRELTLMRNTIWARHGKKFDKDWLHAHFSAQPWYVPKEPVSKPTALERKNLATIAKYDSGLGRDALLDRAKAVRERVGGGPADAEDLLELRLLSTRLGEWQGGDLVPRAERTALEDPSKLDEPIPADTLPNMSLRDLRLLRNTIYARRHRPFVSPSLKAYFAPMAWYQADPKYSDARLTEIDQKNIKLLRTTEDARGGPWNEMDEQGIPKSEQVVQDFFEGA